MHGNPYARAAAKPQAQRRKDLTVRRLYYAVAAFLVITFIRPHDLLPILAVVRPVQICAAVILLFWLLSGDRAALRDAIFRWQLLFLLVMCAGIFVVVNHFWWLSTTIDYAIFLIAFSLGLFSVARVPVYRERILQLLLIAFSFLAIWSLANNGVGIPRSWISDENDVAATLIVGGCLGYGFWTHSGSRRWRVMGLLVGLLCLAGTVGTMSRGGFVALAVATLAIAFFSGRFLRTAAALVLLAIVAIPLAPERYLSEVRSIDDAASTYGRPGAEFERLYSWRRAWDMFVANPIIGVGPGNFAFTVAQYEESPKARVQRGEKRSIAGRAAHSIYFTLLPELGLAGALIYTVIIGSTIVRARRASRKQAGTDDGRSVRIAAMLAGPGLIGYSVAGIFVSVLWYPMIWLLVAFGMVLGSHGATAEAFPSEARRPRRTVEAATANLPGQGVAIPGSPGTSGAARRRAGRATDCDA